MSARDALREQQQQARSHNGNAPAARPFPLTDLGNTERLVAAHGSDIRFIPGIGWHAWDGRRWHRDEDGEVMRRAKLTARSILSEAAYVDDDAARKAIAAWAFRSETEPRLRAAVALAESERPVIARADQLDTDPYLLNVLNGTIDLRTGSLQPHNRDDLITRLSPARYDAEARSERWERSLRRVTDGDAELEAFLARLAGYTAIGVADEEVLAFVHGPGATGKTTTVEAIKGTLGDYASTADFETFLARRGDAGIRNDIARLVGVRMVSSVEVEDGRRLAEGLIKQLTGGDRIAARFLHREFFEFEPRFTLWLVANTRPPARADDDALWRRILLVPFETVIPVEERDPELKRVLRADPTEQSAILGWLVKGALEWQRRGLDVPARVRNRTAEYRAENDLLGDFIADDCVIDPQAWAVARDLRGAYEAWCERNGETPVKDRGWGAQLKARGCRRARLTSGKRDRIWRGIGLADGGDQ